VQAKTGRPVQFELTVCPNGKAKAALMPSSLCFSSDEAILRFDCYPEPDGFSPAPDLRRVFTRRFDARR